MSIFKTPLRYPGGKQRLTPFVSEILTANEIDGHYVEPYAGGAGVGIQLLLSGQVTNIHLNDSFRGIYAFWHSILNFNEEFCRLISQASMTVEEWRRHQQVVKNPDQHTLLELGFSIFFLNRVNRSGVLSAGIIGGITQEGNYKMDARFSRNELIGRIECIGLYRDKISISNLDAEFYIRNYIANLPNNTLVYLDPPYYEKGSQLYLNSYLKKDHQRLSSVIQNEINHKWILSYDGVPEILGLYNERRHFLYELRYTAARSYKGNEVFVFCDQLDIPAHSKLKNVDVGLANMILN